VAPPPEDHTPMWPMFGYNARHSANPFGINVNIPPVNNGTLYWVDTMGSSAQNFNNAPELCIDAAGNIYELSVDFGTSHVIKLRPDGSIIWQKDSTFASAYYGSALTNNETRLYVSDEYGLKCLDSSGNRIWALQGGTCGSPAVDKDGTIYTGLYGYLNAVNPDGSIKWTVSNINLTSCHPALDKDGNIYILHYVNRNSTIYELLKFDIYGNVLWRNTYANLVAVNFLTAILDGYNNTYVTADSLYSIDKNGKTRWTKFGYNSYTMPAITSNNEIIAASTDYIVKLDNSGNVMWKSKVQDVLYQYILIDDNNNSYCMNGFNTPYYASSVDNNGNSRWSVQLPSYWWGSPGPALSPVGMLVSTLKRPWLVYAVK